MSTARRALGLDALRGFAILTMVLSGVVPYGTLPPWMYHAQVPPPDHTFLPSLPGITWVDLVFPFFLFSMGVAIPLALTRRLERGDTHWQIAGFVVGRGALLVFFSIFLQHVRPYVLNPEPTAATWGIALLGFGLLFAIYTRVPATWPHAWRWGLRAVGWVGAAALLAMLRYPDGSGFSLYRNDIILMLLADMAVLGGLLWLATRGRWGIRLGVLALYLGLRLAATEPGWVQDMWGWSPAPWLIQWHFVKYLFIVVPSTLVGDLLVPWMQRPRVPSSGWSAARYGMQAAYLMAFIPLLLVGLFGRWVLATTVVTLVLVSLGYGLFGHPASDTERLLRRFFAWGTCWLLLGLFLEPFEGGIKKDPSTLSYYAVTSGLALYLMSAFMIVIDVLGKKTWLRLLIENGQNPMIAYVGIMNLLYPVFALLGLHGWLLALTPGPWDGFARAVGYTLLLAAVVMFFTRRKLFWRT